MGSEGGRPGLSVDIPNGAPSFGGKLEDEFGIDNMCRQSSTGVTVRTVGYNPVETHCDHIARVGGCNEERSGLGISPNVDLVAVLIYTGTINRGCHNRIPGRDS